MNSFTKKTSFYLSCLMAATLIFSSCSKQMTGIQTTDKLRCEQTLAHSHNDALATNKPVAEKPIDNCVETSTPTTVLANTNTANTSSKHGLGSSVQKARHKQQFAEAVTIFKSNMHQFATAPLQSPKNAIASYKKDTMHLHGYLRIALICLLIALIFYIFSGFSRIFGFIGDVFALIALIFFVLWLLTML